jgi:tungstate transport system ATP-binding protein
MSEELFAARELRASFGGTEVVSIDALSLPEKQVTVFIGENGSGKTTLLRMLNGLLPPSAGSISFRGQPLDTGGVAALRAQSVMLHQSPILFRGTVAQNVCYGLRLRGVARAKRAEKCAAVLAAVGLPGVDKRSVTALSGGEKQRVALARALVLEPKVLLLDEPTANVDPDSRRHVERVIRKAAAGGATVIMSTHSMELAYRMCDRLIRMEGGRAFPPSENILRGTVEKTDDLFTYFRAGEVVLRCPARQGAFVVAVIPMDEIIISHDPLISSARNQLSGTVRDVQQRDGLLVVSVECGVMLYALITPAAASEIGVEKGRECVLTFKASAIRLY